MRVLCERVPLWQITFHVAWDTYLINQALVETIMFVFPFTTTYTLTLHNDHNQKIVS